MPSEVPVNTAQSWETGVSSRTRPWNHQEVHGHEVLRVIVEEGPPGRRRRLLSRPEHVPLDRRLGHMNAELGEFPDDARGAPGRVRTRHRADEVLAALASLGLPGLAREKASPVVAKPAALPSDDGARLDEHQGISPASPGPGQPRPEKTIGDVGPGPGRAPPVDGKLVAQRENLEPEGGSRSGAGAERPEKGKEDRLHEGRRLPHLRRTHREFLAGQPPTKPFDDRWFGILGTHRVVEIAGAGGP